MALTNSLISKLNLIVAGYLKAAFWYDLEETKSNLGLNRLVNEAKLQARQDCDKFLMNNFTEIENIDLNQVGHDLWLSRNGHGSGFWDKPEIYGEDRAKKLHEYAKNLGTKHMSAFGGWVYID